jgi:hydrogenase large subunit
MAGTSVVDPKRPVEILSTVHSFDPCLAYAVQVIDPQEDWTYPVGVA